MTARTTNTFWNSMGAMMVVATLAASSSISMAQQNPNLTPRSAEARQYEACMVLAREDPKAAHESAQAWLKKGGGDAAVHCVAVALLGLGNYSQAGQTMAELAARTDGSRITLKAGLLGQAANAWLISGQPQRSENLLTDALALVPKDVELLLDRSIARASLGKYWEALDDLNDALERNPDRTDALTFRASAWRHVDALDLAEADIATVLKRRPDYPDGLLERGLIRKARGDRAGARADWLRVLDIVIEGPLTEAARRYLETMDVTKQ
jgi:tetratricopeptide (TPR) repeat protein